MAAIIFTSTDSDKGSHCHPCGECAMRFEMIVRHSCLIGVYKGNRPRTVFP